jgi:hypothetical protein
MDKELKEKFQQLAREIEDSMVNPDIDIEPCFDEECYSPRKFPYVKLRYTTNEHNVHEKDIEISPDHWDKSVSELKEYITFMIEQFMEEIDSVEYGGE